MAYEVKIRVYDLSKGQARLISRNILGVQIDGIWHSSVEIHGKEIFLSHEITCTVPGQTRYGTPTYVHEYGISHTTEEDLNEMLDVLREKYNRHTYNMLENNCNHFADDLCFFLLEKKLPQYIMDVHEIVSKTPFGSHFLKNSFNFNPGARD
ncbi:hypothetical protein M153_9404000136 [Pseudoloma neurophilia]|uniref:PPPDE domain-containing protein n=1 Tax=Pseudoloma neurophilia TaxID=146866 RepID=A0A0R0LSK5_9MICR|nr:hypothetical protein M153_9404000136 [Pseudoloma neurophilia]